MVAHERGTNGRVGAEGPGSAWRELEALLFRAPAIAGCPSHRRKLRVDVNAASVDRTPSNPGGMRLKEPGAPGRALCGRGASAPASACPRYAPHLDVAPAHRAHVGQAPPAWTFAPPTWMRRAASFGACRATFGPRSRRYQVVPDGSPSARKTGASSAVMLDRIRSGASRGADSRRRTRPTHVDRTPVT
jgi:hypothetical protein